MKKKKHQGTPFGYRKKTWIYFDSTEFFKKIDKFGLPRNIILFIDIEIKILQSHWYSLNLWLNKKKETSFMTFNVSSFYINIEKLKMNVGLKIIIWIVKDFSWKKINHVDLTNGRAFIMINWMIPISYYWETCRSVVEIF